MKPFFDVINAGWAKPQALKNASFDCGYCGDRISSEKGYKVGVHADGSGAQLGGVYICSNCAGPNFFVPGGGRYPTPAVGQSVPKLPEGLGNLYEEARRCTSQACFTAAVLLCRKMLMNIAVTEGAAEGLKFIEYVEFLATKGYVPPNGRHWVDHIRKRGNEATHEIALMTESDARELVVFTEMLLRFIYEFPSLVPKPPPP